MNSFRLPATSFIAVLLIGSSILSAPAGQAQTVTFEITGAVYDRSGSDPSFLSAFSVGTTYTATYVYNAATNNDAFAGTDLSINLDSVGNPFSATLNLGGNVYTGGNPTSNSINVYDNRSGHDGVEFNYAAPGSLQYGFHLTGMHNFLLTTQAGLFSNDALSNAATLTESVAFFDYSASGTFNFTEGNLSTTVTGYSISVSAIPEPSTYAAFAGLGALGLALWRRRQKTAAA